MLSHVLSVLSLGFFCGLIPGPVVTAIFTETIRAGKSSARRIVYWAAAGEVVMSVVCVSLLAFVPAEHSMFSVLGIFGALLLFSLAWDLWKIEEIREEEPLFSNRRVFFIAILNGMAWIFWITVCTPQAVELGRIVPYGRWLFIVLFELGWLASTLLLAQLFFLFRPYFQSNKTLHFFYRTVAIFFLFFGLKLAYGSAQRLMQL